MSLLTQLGALEGLVTIDEMMAQGYEASSYNNAINLKLAAISPKPTSVLNGFVQALAVYSRFVEEAKMANQLRLVLPIEKQSICLLLTLKSPHYQQLRQFKAQWLTVDLANIYYEQLTDEDKQRFVNLFSHLEVSFIGLEAIDLNEAQELALALVYLFSQNLPFSICSLGSLTEVKLKFKQLFLGQFKQSAHVEYHAIDATRVKYLMSFQPILELQFDEQSNKGYKLNKWGKQSLLQSIQGASQWMDISMSSKTWCFSRVIPWSQQLGTLIVEINEHRLSVFFDLLQSEDNSANFWPYIKSLLFAYFSTFPSQKAILITALYDGLQQLARDKL